METQRVFVCVWERKREGEGCRCCVWYAVLYQARLVDHPAWHTDIHKLVSGIGQGFAYTHYTHESQGHSEQRVPGDPLLPFFFLSLSLTFIGDRYKSPHSSILSQIHIQYTIMSASH